jgi:hypothetical protein
MSVNTKFVNAMIMKKSPVMPTEAHAVVDREQLDLGPSSGVSSPPEG